MNRSTGDGMDEVRPNRMDVDLGALRRAGVDLPILTFAGALPEAASKLLAGVIPFGLADGYRPVVPGQPACALDEGKRVPIRGVSLEQQSPDLSDHPEARDGDEVPPLGESGGETITLGDLAEWQGTRIHRVLMALDQRVPVRYADG